MSSQPDTEHVDETPQDNRDIRQLREKAKKADQMAAEMTTLKRDLAMARAGVNLDSPTGKLFYKAYDGEPTVEAVTAAASEYGLIGQDGSNQPAALAQQQVAATAAGGEADRQIDVLDAWKEGVRSAKNPADAKREILRIAQAAGMPTKTDFSY